MSELSTAKQPWNKGRRTGQKRPLLPKQVWSLRVRLELQKSHRELALFNLAIDSKLRASDLVRIRTTDICSDEGVRDRGMVVQKKTGRAVQFEITRDTRTAVESWISDRDRTDTEYLFPSRQSGGKHMSVRQYARIVRRWIRALGLDPVSYGTHSMRRSKAAQIYRKTGNLRAVQLLLGHTKLESTVRYLGIEVDDAIAIAEQVEL